MSTIKRHRPRRGSCRPGRAQDRPGQLAGPDVKPGSCWRVILTRDEDRFHGGVQRTDFKGDLDVDRFRGNPAEEGTLGLRVVRVGGAGSCGATTTRGGRA